MEPNTAPSVQTSKRTRGKKTLDEVEKEFENYRNSKAKLTGGVEARVLNNIFWYYGEHNAYFTDGMIVGRPIDEDQMYLPFNKLPQKQRKLIGRLIARNLTFKSKPNKRDPKSIANAEVVDIMLRAINQKLEEDDRAWDRWWWRLIGGVAVDENIWVPDKEIEMMPRLDEQGRPLYKHVPSGELYPEEVMRELADRNHPQFPKESFEIDTELQLVGDLGTRVIGPLQIFLPSRSRSIRDIPPGFSYMTADVRTHEWIKDNWPGAAKIDLKPTKELKILKTTFVPGPHTLGNNDLAELIPVIQGVATKDDPDMSVVVNRWAPLSTRNPKGRLTVAVLGSGIVYDDRNPYEHRGIPGVDFHWDVTATTFFSKAWMDDQIQPQKYFNVRMSQTAEHANSHVHGLTLLGGNLRSKDITNSAKRPVEKAITRDGIPLVQKVQTGQIGSWFFKAIETAVSAWDEIAGGTDLTSSNTGMGQMRGPEAIPLLMEMSDSEWSAALSHDRVRMEQVMQMRIALVRQFYPPFRTMNYTDKGHRDEVLEFHSTEILRAGVDYFVSIEPGTHLPEFRAVREQRIAQRFQQYPGLYVDRRSGQVDWSRLATDLEIGDFGREERLAQSRKMQVWELEKLKMGIQFPILPSNDHSAHLDEIDAVMEDEGWWDLSDTARGTIEQHRTLHQDQLNLEAQQAQASMENELVRAAVAQSTQQVTAQTTARMQETVTDVVLANMRAFMEQQFGGAPVDVTQAGPPGGGQAPIAQRSLAE